MKRSSNLTRSFSFLFSLLLVLGVVLFRDTIAGLAALSFSRETYSHIPLIPAASIVLLFLRRKEIFKGERGPWLPGLFLIGAAAGVLLLEGGPQQPSGEEGGLSLAALGLVIWMDGAFLICFGPGAFKRALFPLLFLLVAVPVPEPVLDHFIVFLQEWSADFSHVLFKAVGVPVFRDGLYFSLPGINIEVAKQCSGIRSTIGVFITGAVAAHLFLRRPLSGVLLILCIVPITIFKNAVRITTITLLAVYVDPKFLTHHWIHKSGGMVFAAMALSLVALVLWGLRSVERRAESVERRAKGRELGRE